jgi:hypothetical protein
MCTNGAPNVVLVTSRDGIAITCGHIRTAVSAPMRRRRGHTAKMKNGTLTPDPRLVLQATLCAGSGVAIGSFLWVPASESTSHSE